jgi:hypothetical protein
MSERLDIDICLSPPFPMRVAIDRVHIEAAFALILIKLFAVRPGE